MPRLHRLVSLVLAALLALSEGAAWAKGGGGGHGSGGGHSGGGHSSGGGRSGGRGASGRGHTSPGTHGSRHAPGRAQASPGQHGMALGKAIGHSHQGLGGRQPPRPQPPAQYSPSAPRQAQVAKKIGDKGWQQRAERQLKTPKLSGTKPKGGGRE
jgi:hypothetical protein